MLSRPPRASLLRDICIVLPLCLSLLSAAFPYYHPDACKMSPACLVAGFPLWFVQDITGDSPTGSWGKIDATDYFLYANPARFFLNYGVYVLLVAPIAWTMRWLIRRRLAARPLHEPGA
ncbi:MAG: hypothetical protein OHK0022_54030 [Roseiflexaceae bacterium]